MDDKEKAAMFAMLMDEKEIATQKMKQLKKNKDFGDSYTVYRSYRNKVSKALRELRSGHEEK